MCNISLGKNIYSSKILLDLYSDSIPFNSFKEDIKEQSDKKSFPLEKRKVLHELIFDQYKKTGIDVPVIHKYLLDDNCYTITTGHQLCLFGGPQYFIHKIISIIKLAELLKDQYPDMHIIPVFWMASEDHDFKEISNVSVFNKVISVNGENLGPVGRIKTEVFKPALVELIEMFKNDNRGNYLIEIFKEAFKREYWSDCTRYWVSMLFDDYDLLIIDADDLKLKSIFSPLMAKEVDDQFSYKSVLQGNKELIKSGYDIQVNPREINLFYIDKGLRERIILENNKFNIGANSYSKNELLSKLDDNPENFSPNVLLRPLYQETILPNLVYVGGPAEISYWSQLQITFNVADITFPKLLLRESFGWIKKLDIDWWNEQKFMIKDLFEDFDALVKRIHFNDDNAILPIDENLKLVNNSILDKIMNIDPSLEGMLNSELTKFKKGLIKIQSRLIANSKKKNESYFKRVKKIQESVIKNKILNERKDSFIQNYIESDGSYISKLMEESAPLSASLKLLIKD